MIVVILAASLMTLAGVCGVLAAIAIPSFVHYVRRAQAAEAHRNVRVIYFGVADHAQHLSRLPPSLPDTPSTVPCGERREPWPADAHPGWADVGFAPLEPLHYSYALLVHPNGRDFTVRARGDLDCDGVTSVYELHGQFDPETGIVTQDSELMLQDELE